MFLNIPVEKLLASQLNINLRPVDGSPSCHLKPNPYNNYHARIPNSWVGITLNIEGVLGDNGYVLTLYASAEENLRPPLIPSTPSDASPPTAGDCTMHLLSHSAHTHISATDIENNLMSLILARASPPPDFFPDTSYESSPVSSASSEHLPYIVLDDDLRFDASSYGTSGFDAHQFSQLAAPNDGFTDATAPPSDCGGLGPSPLPSPYLSFHASPSPVPDTANMFPLSSSSASASTPPSASGSGSPSLAMQTTFVASASPSMPETDPAANPGKERPGRRAQYPCSHPTCGRVLTSPYTRQVHMGTHRKVRKTFLCTFGCGEAFTRQHDRQRHEVALHGKKCSHVCARCTRFFSSAKILDRHVCRSVQDGAPQWSLGKVQVAIEATTVS